MLVGRDGRRGCFRCGGLHVGLGLSAMKVNAMFSIMVDRMEMQLYLRVRSPKKSLGNCLVDGTLINFLVQVVMRLSDEVAMQLEARRLMLLLLFARFIKKV